MLSRKLFLSAFLAAFVFCSVGIGAAPLRYGFYLAPSVAASYAERAQAFHMARERLLAFAKIFEGTPYLFGGTTMMGMDCSGFVYRSFREALGVSVPRTSESMFLWTERIRRDEIQPGDLVFFRTGTTARITHVGIYVGNGRFIHSASQGRVTGVIFSSLEERYWAGVFAGAGRALPPGARAQPSSPAAGAEPERRFFFGRRSGT